MNNTVWTHDSEPSLFQAGNTCLIEAHSQSMQQTTVSNKKYELPWHSCSLTETFCKNPCLGLFVILSNS